MNKMRTKSFAAISVAMIFTALMTPSAQAVEKGYRYWGYFQSAPGQSTWTAAQTGPTTVVADGSVEGWAFTFSSDSIPDAAAPRVSPNFTKICGTTTAAAGKKRVGVVVDFGSAFLRPRGETTPRSITKCVSIEKSAIGSDIVAAVTKIRASSSGFICGLDGYPAKECGVLTPTPAPLRTKK